MSGIFMKLIEVGIKLGTLSEAHMYDSNFFTIEGVTHEGNKFTLTMNIKEDNKND